jgi:hypothetical protein
MSFDIRDMNITGFEKRKYKSIDLGKKLNKKAFLLQFLPDSIHYLESQKNISFQNKKLKTSYLIDIIHNMILKYYFKKENKFPLNATVLKDKYGYLYNYYIKYLVSNNIIYMKTNYKKGFSSRVYALDDKIFKSKIKRYRNKDKVLLKKYKKKVYQSIDFSDDENYLIDKDVREKLISDLFSVEIEYDRSIFFLESLKDKDFDIYNRNVYSVDCINDKHIFYHFDNYGRLHSNYTILRTFIRKNCLLIDGYETYEIDIKNSQPLFLLKLIKDSNTKWINSDEIKLFDILVRNGNFYRYLIDNLGLVDKKDAKHLTYKVLFGRNYKNCKSSIMFSKLFPTIFNYIKLYKRETCDYRSLSYALQRMESNFIFNILINKIMLLNSDIKIITVHDSIIVDNKYRDFIYNIFNDELYKYLS